MSNEPVISRKIGIDGIDPELFNQFKLCLFHQKMSMREAVLTFIRSFIKAVEVEIDKGEKE
ncbi:unnamed protein product [marine sediment metagenome]|uniref:Uncharacterized protein n=2 Tax=marine sediment metagenome TaxID=412755 RepID=X1KFW7_9ZZZZ